MRRVLVIFLILLFPLNVFALSLSAATLAQPAAAVEGVHAIATQADAVANDTGDDGSCDQRCDIDPDEPPSGADLHYIVGRHGCVQLAGLAAATVALHDAAPRCHAIAPPEKPPRGA